jgi:hypothetical protein
MSSPVGSALGSGKDQPVASSKRRDAVSTLCSQVVKMRTCAQSRTFAPTVWPAS